MFSSVVASLDMAIGRSSGPAASQSTEAFGADVLDYLTPLYSAALRLTRSRPDAEDLVQDTVVKALRFADRFTRGTNLKAWLFTILHNTWRNTRRGAARNPVEADSDLVDLAEGQAVGGPSVTPETLLLRATLDVELRAALDRLPDAFREAVWLRDVEEFSYAEIAAMLDIPVGTVMSRISRGRRLLFTELTTQPVAGGPVAAGRGYA